MNLLDLIFPKKCVSCRKYGAFLCRDCLDEIREIRDICPVCGKPTLFGETHSICRTKHSLDGLISAFYYNKVIREAIHRFKYRPYITSLAPIFSRLIFKVIKEKKKLILFIRNGAVLVPIPLHWWRKHIRGYNQAEVLADEIGRNLKVPVYDILVRTKLTTPQSELSFRERRKNVRDIFDLKTNNIPQSIVLVDDVWTSGETIKSACKVLKKNGAKRVWALTLAR